MLLCDKNRTRSDSSSKGHYVSVVPAHPHSILAHGYPKSSLTHLFVYHQKEPKTISVSIGRQLIVRARPHIEPSWLILRTYSKLGILNPTHPSTIPFCQLASINKLSAYSKVKRSRFQLTMQQEQTYQRKSDSGGHTGLHQLKDFTTPICSTELEFDERFLRSHSLLPRDCLNE